MENKRESILLTTLSTVRYSGNMYYYDAKKDDSDKKSYCRGIASIEPGAKYLLSKYNIDHILVIGSEQVYEKGDYIEGKAPELLKDIDLKGMVEKGALSGIPKSYKIFKYRMAKYIQDALYGKKDKDPFVEASIKLDDEQKSSVEKTVCEYMQQIYPEYKERKGEWFARLGGNYTGLKAEIEKKIEQDYIISGKKIEKDYMLSEDVDTPKAVSEYMSQYENDVIKIFADFEKKIENVSYDVTISSKAKIEKLQKILYSMIQIVSLKIGIQDDSVKSIFNELIQQMTLKIEKLTQQINDLKNNRIASEFSYAQAYLYEISDDKLAPQKELLEHIDITFMPLQKDGESNLNGIVERIQQYSRSGNIDLYIDLQGGSRTDLYARNSILSILSNEYQSSISLKNMVATEFENSKTISTIKDETEKYSITELVSGMNAFIQYGKADMIKQFYEKNKKENNENLDRLVDDMVKIDHAITLCKINSLMDAIDDLSNLLKDDSIKNIRGVFGILVAGIENDYKSLLDIGEIEKNPLPLIKWCYRKKFYQQALTLIEDKMPSLFFDRYLDIEVRTTEGNAIIIKGQRDGHISENDLEESSRYKTLKSKPMKGASYEKRWENILFYYLEKAEEDHMLDNYNSKCVQVIEKRLTEMLLDKTKNMKHFGKNQWLLNLRYAISICGIRNVYALLQTDQSFKDRCSNLIDAVNAINQTVKNWNEINQKDNSIYLSYKEALKNTFKNNDALKMDLVNFLNRLPKKESQYRTVLVQYISKAFSFSGNIKYGCCTDFCNILGLGNLEGKKAYSELYKKVLKDLLGNPADFDNTLAFALGVGNSAETMCDTLRDELQNKSISNDAFINAYENLHRVIKNNEDGNGNDPNNLDVVSLQLIEYMYREIGSKMNATKLDAGHADLLLRTAFMIPEEDGVSSKKISSEYKVIDNKTKEESKYDLEFTIKGKNGINLSDEMVKKYFEQIMRLQIALKYERNQSNHASTKSINLPFAATGKAIELYIQLHEKLEGMMSLVS